MDPEQAGREVTGPFLGTRAPVLAIREVVGGKGCAGGSESRSEGATSASKHGWSHLHCPTGAAVEHVEQDQGLVVEGLGTRDRGDEPEGQDGTTAEFEVDAVCQVDDVRHAAGVVSVGPVAGTGLLTSDGLGGLVGTETISYGLGPCVLTLAGTYSVNADGTGTGSVTVTSAVGGPLCTSGNTSNVDFSFVLSGGPGTADKIKLSETSTGFAILAHGERQ